SSEGCAASGGSEGDGARRGFVARENCRHLSGAGIKKRRPLCRGNVAGGMSMATPTVRPAAVAGRFYPQDPKKLAASVRSYTISSEQPEPALGCVVPHAG